MCDIRIASGNARFAASFIKLGIVPADGGAWLLSRTVGPAKALELILTGETIDANAAKAIGLVSRITTPEKLLEEATKLAQSIAAHPPRTVRLTKRLLRESAHSSLASSLELAAAYQALAHHRSEEHKSELQSLMRNSYAVFCL